MKRTPIEQARGARRTNRHLAGGFLVVALAISAAAHGQSDIALFRNGDRLTGEIKALRQRSRLVRYAHDRRDQPRMGRYRSAVLHDDVRGDSRKRRANLRNARRNDGRRRGPRANRNGAEGPADADHRAHDADQVDPRRSHRNARRSRPQPREGQRSRARRASATTLATAGRRA